MKHEGKKLALALGSGGAKGFAHIGVLKAFEEAGIHFDIVTGSSMGAIVGSCYALGVTSDKLEERAIKLSSGDIFDIKLPNSYGFIKGDKAEKTIRAFLDAEDKPVMFSDCLVPFACVASDISKAELVKLTAGDIISAVRASFSICGVFRPVLINGRKLLDGGIFCRVPVDIARELGANYVVAVDCIGETKEEEVDNFKYLDTISRIFNIMDYQISKPEIERSDFLISLYQPNVSAVRINNIKESIEIGYNETKKCIPKIKKLLKEHGIR